MKTYGIFILLLVVCSACRSNKHSDRAYVNQQSAEETHTVVRKDSTRSEREGKNTVGTTTNDIREVETTYYRPDGTIQKIQRERRKSGSTQLSVSDTRSSDVSVTTDSTHRKKQEASKTTENKTTVSVVDNRPVQGSEWLYVAGVTGVILIIVIIILIRKFTKKT